MIPIIKRLFTNEVYAGTAAIVAVSILGPFVFNWSAEVIGVVDAGIAALTGTTYSVRPST